MLSDNVRLDSLGHWQRRGVYFAAGVFSILAMAPFFLSPVLFLTLPVLVAGLDAAHRSPKARQRAFEAGWWFGFGYHSAGLFWIGEAFLVEAETFGFLLPFAVTMMPAGLALFWGVAALAAQRHWPSNATRVIVLAISLSVAEWLRGHILTGFPWNIIGYALTFPLPMMQWASVIGIYGLTLAAVILFAWPVTRWLDGWRPGTEWDKLAFGFRAFLPLCALFGIGTALLIGQAPAPDTGLQARLVQPSVPQREKWIPANQERIFREHIDLSLQDSAGHEDAAAGKQLIVWPEAAMPFLPLQSPGALSMIGDMLPRGSYLASGALRAEDVATGASGRRAIYNSLLIFGTDGQLAAHYDKLHLVPFGEYLPLQTVLERIGLQQLTKLRGGFASGVRPRPLLDLTGLPLIGPLICYEAIFPGAVVQGAQRPAILLNVTNDGWFGNTTGPRQHLHQARVRAAEEGLPILRAANNGISAIIDAQGRVRGFLDMNVKGSLDGAIPSPGQRTLYSRIGDWGFAGLLLLCFVLILVRRQNS